MAVARRNVIRRECALLSRPSGNSELAFDQAILWMARTSPYPSLPLHVWAWKENPKGAFVNWRPAVFLPVMRGSNHSLVESKVGP